VAQKLRQAPHDALFYGVLVRALAEFLAGASLLLRLYLAAHVR
jgi:hypothetical protein